MSCSEIKQGAITDFNGKSFAAGSAPIQIYEKTTDTAAEVSVTHGSVNQDLSNKISYDCFDGMLLLKLTDPADSLTNISNNPPVVANNKFNRFANIAIPSDYTSVLIGDQEPEFSIATCTVTEQKKGWKLADYKIVLERNTESGTGGVPAATWGGPGEVFQLSDQQTLASTETNVSFDMFKRGSSGAASSTYGGSADDPNPITITPTTLLMYSADSEGFNPENFTGPYRPTVALRFTYGITQTTATAVSIKLYINGTLIQTVSGGLSGSIVWAFSVLGVGNFGVSRPPQNNPADSYNGWASPSVTVSITTGATGGKLSAGTKMEDLVLNYTAS